MIFHCPYCGIKVAPSVKTCPTCAKTMLRRCPHCAEDIAANAKLCKYCGEGVASGKPPLRVAPRPTPGIEFIEDAPAGSVPWEDTNKGVFRRWWGTFFATSFSPLSFFKGMKKTGHKWPIGYTYGFVAQMIFLAFLATLVTGGVMLADHQEISNETAWTTVGAFAVGIPATFVLYTIVLYLGSFLWHIPVMLLGGKGGFESTLRIVGYQSGSWLWWVPIVSAPYAILLKYMLLYSGFRNLHQMSRFRSVLCLILNPTVLLMLAAVVFSIVAPLCGASGGAEPVIQDGGEIIQQGRPF